MDWEYTQTLVRGTDDNTTMGEHLDAHLKQMSGTNWEMVAVTNSVDKNVRAYRFFWKKPCGS